VSRGGDLEQYEIKKLENCRGERRVATMRSYSRTLSL